MLIKAILALLTGAAVIVVPRPAGAATVSTRTMLGQLNVAAAHSAGYDRSKFPLWIDADHDGCDTRREVLIAEATTKPRVGSGCAFTGGRWYSRYDGDVTTDAGSFDIDHLVPLAEAWRSGAWRWSTAVREQYANDLGYGPDLVAVSAHANRSKGDSEPSGYLPPRRSFDCRYEAWWVAVKWRWHLSVDAREKTWLANHLSACGWPTVTRPSRPATGTGTVSTGGVRIAAISFDPPGADSGTNASLNGEWVRVRNTSGSRKVITGWTLRDASSHVYRFPSTSLGAGATLRVHTGRGAADASNRYWGLSEYVWNNSGDTATLGNSHGTRVDRCSYTSVADPVVTC